MLAAFRELIAHQYEAALCTLGIGVARCPDVAWNAPVGNWAFCQAAFHTLFFADYYLGESPDALTAQPFHRENAEFFRDYEELQPRPPSLLYERVDIQKYLAHCRAKALAVTSAETESVLSGPCGFPRKTFSRAELHVYNIRHIQHHAAQMSLRLRLNHQVDVPWVRSGWEDV